VKKGDKRELIEVTGKNMKKEGIEVKGQREDKKINTEIEAIKEDKEINKEIGLEDNKEKKKEKDLRDNKEKDMGMTAIKEESTGVHTFFFRI